ncbi:hypothetical protein GBA52_003098 [Prunus armeniaca]|nr:hypothetical protein GBA52_003098 [Prunus armeniaca]
MSGGNWHSRIVLTNPQIALHPELRANFNSMEAWEYAQSMSGSWIDTMADNYPPRLDTHLVCLCCLKLLRGLVQ